MALVVNGLAASPFVGKVLVALEEKGIPYVHRHVTPNPKTPELLAASPLGKVPFLEHDGFTIPDSSVICAYLERLHPEPALYPKVPRELARALWYEEYSDTRLVQALAPLVVERFVKPRFLGQPTDEAVVKQALEEGIPPVFDYLESQLSEGATLLPQLSIADLAVGCQLQTFGLVGGTVDAARWPKLARYLSGLRQRRSFQRQLA